MWIRSSCIIERIINVISIVSGQHTDYQCNGQTFAFQNNAGGGSGSSGLSKGAIAGIVIGSVVGALLLILLIAFILLAGGSKDGFKKTASTTAINTASENSKVEPESSNGVELA